MAGAAAVRSVTAPLAFLAMAIPLPALVINAATLPLQVTASQIAETTLRTAGVAVFRDGNVLELPAATLEVAQACSGLRSTRSFSRSSRRLGTAGIFWSLGRRRGYNSFARRRRSRAARASPAPKTSENVPGSGTVLAFAVSVAVTLPSISGSTAKKTKEL